MNRIVKKASVTVIAMLAAVFSALAPLTAPVQLTLAGPSAQPTNTVGCQLDSARGNIQHVIYIQFDNVHFTRDNPNVPSDLEQMPNLLNFVTNNGVMLTNHHTPLISHTGDDILTALTGTYGDHHGVPVSNSYRFFNTNGTSSSTAAFAYWTDTIADGKHNMITG